MLSWFRKGKPNESGGQHVETDRMSRLDVETAKINRRQGGQELTPDDIARIGPYRVVNRLGEGGMGRVYRVLFERADQSTPQYYALKALTYSEEEADKGQLERFKREIVIGINIRHPNVCRVVDWGFHDDNTPYIVMELLHGEPLAEHIKRYAPLPVE
ncbi:MAG: serine/threonine protein kinase, partial [Candidatus Xenobia bacterium]